MNWQQLLSAKRFGMEHYKNDSVHQRTEYQRDFD